MPSSVRLSPTSLLTTVRFRRWIEAYRSDDNGTTWHEVARAVPDTGRGNPPSLVKLKDGRLVVCGAHSGEVVPFDIIPFFRRQLSVIGSFVYDRYEVETCFALIARGAL